MSLFSSLRELEARDIFYELARHREETVMVKVSVPDERWEVEFFEDGRTEVEVFRSTGSGLQGEAALGRLLQRNSV